MFTLLDNIDIIRQIDKSNMLGDLIKTPIYCFDATFNYESSLKYVVRLKFGLMCANLYFNSEGGTKMKKTLFIALFSFFLGLFFAGIFFVYIPEKNTPVSFLDEVRWRR